MIFTIKRIDDSPIKNHMFMRTFKLYHGGHSEWLCNPGLELILNELVVDPPDLEEIDEIEVSIDHIDKEDWHWRGYPIMCQRDEEPWLAVNGKAIGLVYQHYEMLCMALYGVDESKVLTPDEMFVEDEEYIYEGGRRTLMSIDVRVLSINNKPVVMAEEG